MIQEIWKDVPGTDGRYQVSDLGHLRAIWRRRNRLDPKTFYEPPRIMDPRPTKRGYRNVHLEYADGIARIKGIHVLVLEAFVGLRPKGATPRAYHAAHENGDPTDNRLQNICWKTARENCLDKRRHGTMPHRSSRVLEDGTELFQCRRCKVWKPSIGFHRLHNKASVCKRESECRECRREYRRHFEYARAHGLQNAAAAAQIVRTYRKSA